MQFLAQPVCEDPEALKLFTALVRPHLERDKEFYSVINNCMYKGLQNDVAAAQNMNDVFDIITKNGAQPPHMALKMLVFAENIIERASLADVKILG
jgi:hypothetical protein